jgi:integrase
MFAQIADLDELLFVGLRGRRRNEPAYSRARLTALKPEEAIRLLDDARKSRNSDLADLIELSLFTSLRQSEALGLTWDRVDRTRGVIVLEEAKNGEGRDGATERPRRRGTARRSSSSSEGLVFGSSNWDSFRTAWEATLRRARIANFRWHDLRHTCASWMVQAGRPLQEVKDFLGTRRSRSRSATPTSRPRTSAKQRRPSTAFSRRISAHRQRTSVSKARSRRGTSK